MSARQPVDKLEVPSSVRALLAARIDRLAAREKDVLQTAAVIGREFDEPTLAAVVEQDAPHAGSPPDLERREARS